MNRAIVFERPGDPEVLRLQALPDAQPGVGELKVRHTAIGVNFIDTYHRSGVYPLKLPARLGQEAVGIVEQVGEGVSGFTVGERIAYCGYLGAYAEKHIIPAAQALKVPEGLEDTEVAASLLKGMTVEYLIQRTYPVEAGQTVLWHAAAGGTGLLACQWLKHLGVRVIGTAGTDAKAELAKQHGASDVIVYTRENIVDRVRELTGGEMVGVVFDSVGQATFSSSLDCLRPRGTMVSFGNASGKPSLPDVTLLAQKGSLYLTRPTLANYTNTRAELQSSASALFQVLEQGAVVPLVGQTFPLAEAAEAHRALESRKTQGSTVLLPNSN